MKKHISYLAILVLYISCTSKEVSSDSDRAEVGPVTQVATMPVTTTESDLAVQNAFDNLMSSKMPKTFVVVVIPAVKPGEVRSSGQFQPILPANPLMAYSPDMYVSDPVQMTYVSDIKEYDYFAEDDKYRLMDRAERICKGRAIGISFGDPECLQFNSYKDASIAIREIDDRVLFRIDAFPY